MRLSTDGSHVAAIRSSTTGDSIVLIEIGENTRERVLVEEKRSGYRTRGTRRLRELGWPAANRIVYSIETPYLSEEDGLELLNDRGSNLRADAGRASPDNSILRKTRLYSIGLSGKRKYLAKDWPRADVSINQDRILSWLPNDPEHFLVEFQGNPLRVDARSGSYTVVESMRNVLESFVADHTGKIRVARSFERPTRERGLHARSSITGSWERLIKYDRYVENGFFFAGFSDDPSRIYVYSDRDADKIALFEYDLDRSALGRQVIADPDFDLHLGWLDSSPVDGRLLAVHYYRDRLTTRVFDSAWRPIWDRIRLRFPNQDVRIESQDASGQKMLLIASSDRLPPRAYFHDSESGEFQLVAELYPKLRGIELAPTQAMSFIARDGVEIDVYVTTPQSNVNAPNRVIIFPHDGPATRDVIEWHPAVQFLAQKGFAVVQLNYRGSTGYGREHERRGDHEWGRAVQNDLADTARWLIRKDIATPERIGIFGTGYGGYLALQSLVSHPALFRAGASWGGLTDLLKMRFDDNEDSWDDSVHEILVGNSLTDRARLLETSPARQARRIKSPVLLGHGTDDPSVSAEHLNLMASALRSADAEYEAYRYKNELDEFIDEHNRVDFYLRLADFFERHLGED